MSRSLRRAGDILEVLEGTVVKDLRSLSDWARTFDAKHGRSSPLGALNFTLALIALLACEAGGFFATGAKLHKGRGRPSEVDPGGYIITFIEAFFPRTSYFKKLGKVLADYLRHDLVHGFGSANIRVPFEMALYVDPNTSSEIKVSTLGRKKAMALNSIALAEHTLEAFTQVRKRLAMEPPLAENFAKAWRVRWSPNRRVANQFAVVYQLAHDAGLRFNFKKPRRPLRSRAT